MTEGNSGRLAAKANKLYWDTSRPAGSLADELGISRSKLYALIEPIQLDAGCETCGTPLIFSSRTDRESGRGHCPECETVTELTDQQRAARPAGKGGGAALPLAVTAVRDWTAPGTREVWFAALLGVAAGLLAGAWWRKQ